MNQRKAKIIRCKAKQLVAANPEQFRDEVRRVSTKKPKLGDSHYRYQRISGWRKAKRAAKEDN